MLKAVSQAADQFRIERTVELNPEISRVVLVLTNVSTKFVAVSALGLGCAEKEVGHPYFSPLNVRRRGKRLAL